MITRHQIRAARGLIDWTQSDLSKHTGISQTSIGNIEAGNTKARVKTLENIRKAFGDHGIFFLKTYGLMDNRKREEHENT